jgi:hypothetical protein
VGASLYAAAPVPPGIVYPQGIESGGLPVPPPGGGGGSGGETPRSGNAREGGRELYYTGDIKLAVTAV